MIFQSGVLSAVGKRLKPRAPTARSPIRKKKTPNKTNETPSAQGENSKGIPNHCRNARHGAAAPTEVKGDQLKLRTLLVHVGAVLDQKPRALSPVVVASVVQRCPCGQARPTNEKRKKRADRHVRLCLSYIAMAVK